MCVCVCVCAYLCNYLADEAEVGDEGAEGTAAVNDFFQEGEFVLLELVCVCVCECV